MGLCVYETPLRYFTSHLEACMKFLSCFASEEPLRFALSKIQWQDRADAILYNSAIPRWGSALG